jgi:hypothetical protein
MREGEGRAGGWGGGGAAGRGVWRVGRQEMAEMVDVGPCVHGRGQSSNKRERENGFGSRDPARGRALVSLVLMSTARAEICASPISRRPAISARLPTSEASALACRTRRLTRSRRTCYPFSVANEIFFPVLMLLCSTSFVRARMFVVGHPGHEARNRRRAPLFSFSCCAGMPHTLS